MHKNYVEVKIEIPEFLSSVWGEAQEFTFPVTLPVACCSQWDGALGTSTALVNTHAFLRVINAFLAGLVTGG